MSGDAGNTTHDWSAAVDHEHLRQVRIDPERYAPGGRGTETRVDEDGVPMRKPVMATKDLRFFDGAPVAYLPDGAPRRGMSVVAALSDWLVHTNRHRDGAWTQRYENGIPATDLAAIEGDGTTGTTVHFMPGRPERVTPAQVHRVAAGFPHLRVLILQNTYRQ